MPEAGERKQIVGALPNPCNACPWQIENQGQPHPHGFYSKANIKRLWDGIRRGDAPGMTCHPTDPQMAEFEGYEETAEREQTHECMGSWVMIVRELARFNAACVEVEQETAAGAKLRRDEAFRRYKTAGGTMTRDGLAGWAFRYAIVMPGQAPMRVTVEALNDPGIGCHLTPAWERETAEEATVS